MFVAFRVQDDFPYERIVRRSHRNGAEKLLQIIWQFGSTTVALTSWVERDKNAGIGIDFDFHAKEIQFRTALFQSGLNCLDLL